MCIRDRYISCFRFRASQLLGQLPPSRVSPAKPFSQSAVDYAVPVLIRHGGQHSKSTSKAYIALFICMVTKAIHLELVSDLTSEDVYKRQGVHRSLAPA